MLFTMTRWIPRIGTTVVFAPDTFATPGRGAGVETDGLGDTNGCSDREATAGGEGAGPFWMKFRTSSLRILPLGPVPRRVCRSMACSLAIFRTAGVVRTGPPDGFCEEIGGAGLPELGGTVSGVCPGEELAMTCPGGVEDWSGWMSTRADPTCGQQLSFEESREREKIKG
jgi:hypothetical protein